MEIGAIIVGCVTGFLSAYFGIGGSSIDTPALRTFLGLPPLIALATPLPLAVLKAAIASVAFERQHLVNFRIALYSVLAGAPGIVVGSYLTAVVPGKALMLLTAVVLFLVGIDFIVKELTEKTFAVEKPPVTPSATFVIAVVFPIGILAGLLANGGGIFLVPAYVIFFHLTIKEAIATSLLTVIVMSVPGSVIQYHLGHVDLRIMAFMAIGAIPLSYLGAKLDIRAKSKTVMLLYGVVMTTFAVYFFITQLEG